MRDLQGACFDEKRPRTASHWLLVAFQDRIATVVPNARCVPFESRCRGGAAKQWAELVARQQSGLLRAGRITR